MQVWGGGSWIVFYYNTTRLRWEASTDVVTSPSRDNFVLRPDRGHHDRGSDPDLGWRILALLLFRFHVGLLAEYDGCARQPES